MTEKEWFVDRDVLDTRRALANDDILDTIKHEEWLAMRDHLHNLEDVDGLAGVVIHLGVIEFRIHNR